MSLQNRVTPWSTIEVSHCRGALMGNRGCLHDARRRLVTEGAGHARWIACTLSYKDVRRQVMTPGQYTELFFLDEAVALAAGHRPCALCRRGAFRAFTTAWSRAFGVPVPRATAVDRHLQSERGADRWRARAPVAAKLLPDGAFVVFDDDPQGAWLVCAGMARHWSHAGYRGTRALSSEDVVRVLTPPSIVDTLRAGYRPVLHPTAGD